MTPEVIVTGAGPAGCVAAVLLARAGARVRLFDRARFPRRKLCGDTLNPGARALLASLGLARGLDEAGLEIQGMVVTGSGVRVLGRYPRGVTGLAITRAVLDERLLSAAAGAGVQVEEGTTITAPVVATAGHRERVVGVQLAGHGSRQIARGALCVAADGRHSALAFRLGLSRHPAWPRRWAIGAYYADVDDVGGGFGEMHIRDGYYIGVARVPGGLVNACLVTADRARLRDPEAALRAAVSTDPLLQERFARARRAGPVATLGPLAVECRAAGMPGLLVAGDAGGFVDPMTGDGLRFAIRSGELAARAAIAALDRGEAAPEVLLHRWQREFRRKRAFNRVLRRLVDAPRSVRAAAIGARLAPSLLARVICAAGDVPEGAAA